MLILASQFVGIADQLLISLRSSSPTKIFLFLQPTDHPKLPPFKSLGEVFLRLSWPAVYMASRRLAYGDPEGPLSPKVHEAWALLELYLVLCTNTHPAHTCFYLFHLVTRWVCSLFWVWARVLLSWGQLVWRHQTGFTDGGIGPYGSYSHFEPNLSETLPGVDAPFAYASMSPQWN